MNRQIGIRAAHGRLPRDLANSEEREAAQAVADAEYLLENVLCRKHWTVAIRDELATYIHRIRIGDDTRPSHINPRRTRWSA